MRYNPAFRRAKSLIALNKAYEEQKKFDPATPPPVVEPKKEEPGYLDRARDFFSDVGDSLKGVGTRVIRQGTKGLQQAANYGTRNFEFLEGLVDDDEEARILASLAQSSTGKDRDMYLKQLSDFTSQKDKKDRTQYQQSRMDALANATDDEARYQALRNMHLQEQAKKQNKNVFLDPSLATGEEGQKAISDKDLAQLEKDFGGAFDQYYGGRDTGTRAIGDDSFMTMYDDAKERFNAFRRAKEERSDEDKALTDPKKVLPLQEMTSMPMDRLSDDTKGWMKDNFGVGPDDLNSTKGIKALGSKIQSSIDSGDEKGMQALEYMAKDLPAPQMTRLMMTSMPKGLNAGKELSKMTDDEVIAYMSNKDRFSDDQLRQLDKFLEFTAKYIAPQVQESPESTTPRINRVRKATDDEISRYGSTIDKITNWGPFSLLSDHYIDESKFKRDSKGNITGYDGDIDTEVGGTGMSSGEGKFYRVPDGDAYGSTLFFNPQTGEFNREWIPNIRDYEDLPVRYEDSLNKAIEKQENSILPTLGNYF